VLIFHYHSFSVLLLLELCMNHAISHHTLGNISCTEGQSFVLITLSLKSSLIAVLGEARNLVPALIACGPKSNAAANLRPSAIVPPAVTGTCFSTSSTACGTGESAL
jgi:hypothetical protein